VIGLADQPVTPGGERPSAGGRQALDDETHGLTADVRINGAEQLGQAATLSRGIARNLRTPAAVTHLVFTMNKRKANILLAVLGAVLVVIVILVAGGAWFALSVFHRENTDAATAGEALDAARKRFEGATPIFDVQSGGPVLTRPIPATGPATQLRTMHVLVWDPEQQTLTAANVPLALLRLRDGPIDVLRFAESGNRTEPRQKLVSIRLSELDRFGSSLLVDQEMPDGHRLLVWTE
jgi:hypothetical protein